MWPSVAIKIPRLLLQLQQILPLL